MNRHFFSRLNMAWLVSLGNRLLTRAVPSDTPRQNRHRLLTRAIPSHASRLLTRAVPSRAAVLVALLCVLTGCYHVGGRTDLMPQSIHTIAIPAFLTVTSNYKLVDTLPQAISKEFLTRTRFRVVNDPSQADAILNGTILAAIAYPNVADPVTGRSISERVVVVLTVSLIERSTGKVLYTRPNWSARQDYAAAVDPHQLFDESGPAFDRLNRDVARDLVSAVMENF